MNKMTTVYGIAYDHNGTPRVIAAEAEVKPKTVRLLKNLGLNDREAFGYRRVVPRDEVLFSAREAIDKAKRDTMLRIATLRERLNDEREKLNFLTQLEASL